MELIKINKEIFILFNGDIRYKYLHSLLLEKGEMVVLKELISPDSIADSITTQHETVVILPFNATNEEQSMLLKHIAEGSIVFSGELCSYAQKIAVEKNIHCINILNDNEFCRDNAIITAEGTLSNVINNTNHSICKSRILIFGYGNVGKALGNLFSGCKADVCIVSKEAKELKLAKSNKLKTIKLSNILHENISNFCVVINTIPVKNVISKEVLSNLSSDTLVIDLASGKENVDSDFCEKNGISYLKTMGIPGKTAPLSAAKYILASIERNLYQN